MIYKLFITAMLTAQIANPQQDVFPAAHIVFADNTLLAQTPNNNATAKSSLSESKEEDFVIQNGILVGYTGIASIIKVPDGVTEIASRVFYRESENTIELYLPDSVQKLDEYAFASYHGKKITGGNGVTEIGRRAFLYSDAELPDFPNAKAVAPEALYLISTKNDGKLQKLRSSFPEAFEGIVSENNDFVIKNGILREYKGTASIIKIPEGVKTIAAEVFRFHVSTDEYCPIEVYLPKSIRKIDARAFQYCGSLTKVAGLENVKEIGKRAFHHCGIYEANLRDVESIGEEAFCCSELSVLSGLGKIKEIKDSAFVACPLTSSAQFREKSQYRVVQKLTNGKENAFLIANGILFCAEDFCSGDLIIPDGVTDITTHISGNITSITIPDSVVRIGEDAFSNNYKLKWIKMQDSVQEIGRKAFENCKNLTEVRLSDSIRELNGCFQYCSKLKNITLPASIEKISADALPKEITSITCPSGMTNIDFKSSADEKGTFLDSLLVGQGTFYVPEVDENSLLAGYAKEIGRNYCPIELETTSLTLKAGEKYPLHFKGNAKATWETSDKKIATVGSTGIIYAKKAGKTTITATIYGKKYECKVTVIKPNGEIPLTPEYFPDEAFRELLSALIDVDKNGILTLEEREQLTELRNTCYDMENSETDEYYEVHTPRNEAERTMYFWLNRVVSLEGIEYFPKLRLLVVDETAEREWYYSNALLEEPTIYLESFHAENMPELESVQLLTKIQSVTIKNAPKLRYLCLRPLLSVETCKITLKDCDSVEILDYRVNTTPIFDFRLENLCTLMLSVSEDVFWEQVGNAFDFSGLKRLSLSVREATKDIAIRNIPNLESLTVYCNSQISLSGLNALKKLKIHNASGIAVNDCENIKKISLHNIKKMKYADFSMSEKLETIGCEETLINNFCLFSSYTSVYSGMDTYLNYCGNTQFFAPRAIPDTDTIPADIVYKPITVSGSDVTECDCTGKIGYTIDLDGDGVEEQLYADETGFYINGVNQGFSRHKYKYDNKIWNRFYLVDADKSDGKINVVFNAECLEYLRAIHYENEDFNWVLVREHESFGQYLATYENSLRLIGYAESPSMYNESPKNTLFSGAVYDGKKGILFHTSDRGTFNFCGIRNGAVVRNAREMELFIAEDGMVEVLDTFLSE